MTCCDAALDTSGTFWGAICFLIGAALLLPEARQGARPELRITAGRVATRLLRPVERLDRVLNRLVDAMGADLRRDAEGLELGAHLVVHLAQREDDVTLV